MLAARQMKWRPTSPAGWYRRGRPRGGRGVPVLASAAKQAMKARGRDQIRLESGRVESQHAPEAREESAPAGRQIRVARVGPSNVRAERAAQAPRIGLVGEVVRRARRGKRVAVLFPAHHRRGQPFAQVCIATGLPVELAPEARHVLAQLAQHEIAAVASEVGLLRRVLGPRQPARPGRAAGQAADAACRDRIRWDNRAGTRRGRRGCRSRAGRGRPPGACGPNRPRVAKCRRRNRTAPRAGSRTSRGARCARSRPRIALPPRVPTPPAARAWHRGARRRAASARRRPIASRPDRWRRRLPGGARARRRSSCRRRIRPRTRRTGPERPPAHAAPRS